MAERKLFSYAIPPPKEKMQASGGSTIVRARKAISRKRKKITGGHLTEQGSGMDIVPVVHQPASAVTAATRADLRRGLRKVRRDQQLKFSDTYHASASLAAAGSAQVTALNLIAAGNTDSTRVGNEIVITSLQVRYNLSTIPTSAAAGQAFRILIVWDYDVGGAVSTLATVLDTSVILDPLRAPYHMDYVGKGKRYRIVYDETIIINESIGSSADYAERVLKFKRLNKKVRYTNTTAAIGSVGTNSLCLMALQDQSANLPTMEFGARVYFKDA